MSVSYIDRCVQAVESIDVAALSELTIGDEVDRGHETAFKHLGRLGVLGDEIYVGLKIPVPGNRHDAEFRFQGDVEAIESLLRYMPEYAPKPPKFMALLRVGEGKPVALLTEDVTRGGEVKAWPIGRIRDEPSELARSIIKAFEGVEGAKVLDRDIDYSLAFIVGDETRFLDFTPPPVWLSHREGCDISQKIDHLIDDGSLVIGINPQSPLGVSLEGLPKPATPHD